MKTIISVTITLLAALTQATLPPDFDGLLTFHGATPDASYTLGPPTNGGFILIGNSLSVSSISSFTSTNCTALGIDGSVTTIVGVETVPVAPPQTQVVVECTELGFD